MAIGSPRLFVRWLFRAVSPHLFDARERHWYWNMKCGCLLLLISMLWHKQAIFESKGDKLSLSAECRIRTRSSSRLKARWQTDWAIEDQAKKNLNSIARPYDQRAFSPFDPNALAFAPGSGDIHVCCFSFRCSGTGVPFSNRKETNCLRDESYLFATAPFTQTH